MLGSQVAFVTITRLLTIAIVMGSSAVVARTLGPAGQGVYALVMTFAATIVQFGTLGLNSSNTYFLAKDNDLREAIVGNTIWVSIVFGSLAAAVTTLVCQLVGWSSEVGSWYLWLGAAMVPARLFILLGSNVMLALNQVTAFNLSQLGIQVSTSLVMIVVCAFSGDLDRILMASLLVSTGGAVALAMSLLRRCESVPRWNPAVLWSGVGYALKAHVACLLAFAVLRINVLLLQLLAGSAEVGQYSVASQIIDGIQLLPSSAAMVLLPHLVRNLENSWTIMLQSLAVVAGTMLVVCAIAAVTVDYFILYTFGPDFSAAGSMVRWMLPGTFCYALIGVVSQFLAAKGFPRVMISVWAFAVAILSISATWAIREHAGIGAAIALSLTYAVVLVLISLAAIATNREAVPAGLPAGA